MREKIEDNLRIKNKIIEAFGFPPLSAEEIYREYASYGEKLAPFVRDVSAYLNQEIKAGRNVLFEGAQGALLDIDFGTYPYVTSSNCTAGGVCTGLGLSPKQVQAVLGITKAYTTRVGSGPFPTELKDETGAAIARKGDEFGATTGRPRRCGWFDAVAVRYACRLSGVDVLALTKPDVLEELGEIKACFRYRYRGSVITEFPSDPYILDKVEPEYRTFPVWKGSIHRLKNYRELPEGFLDYLRWIEDTLEIKVVLISTGVDREDVIYLKDEMRRVLGDRAELLGK
ncbi:MAG: adenylosuccinate synthetase [Candidatus Saccharicenans sp.]